MTNGVSIAVCTRSTDVEADEQRRAVQRQRHAAEQEGADDGRGERAHGRCRRRARGAARVRHEQRRHRRPHERPRQPLRGDGGRVLGRRVHERVAREPEVRVRLEPPSSPTIAPRTPRGADADGVARRGGEARDAPPPASVSSSMSAKPAPPWPTPALSSALVSAKHTKPSAPLAAHTRHGPPRGPSRSRKCPGT